MALFILKKVANKALSEADIMALATDLMMDELTKRGWSGDVTTSYTHGKKVTKFHPQFQPSRINEDEVSVLFKIPEVRAAYEKVKETVVYSLGQVEEVLQGLKAGLTDEGLVDSAGEGKARAILGFQLMGQGLRADISIDPTTALQGDVLDERDTQERFAIQERWLGGGGDGWIPQFGNFEVNVPGMGVITMEDMVVVDGQTIVAAFQKARKKLSARGWTGTITVLGGKLGMTGEGGNGVAVGVTLPVGDGDGAEDEEEDGPGALDQLNGHISDAMAMLQGPDKDMIKEKIREAVDTYLAGLLQTSADDMEEAAVSFYATGEQEDPTEGTLSAENCFELMGYGVRYELEVDLPSIIASERFQARKQEGQDLMAQMFEFAQQQMEGAVEE